MQRERRYVAWITMIALGATASAFLALGCGSASTQPTQTTARASVSGTTAPAAFLPSDCMNQVEQPSSFIIACGDGGSGVEHLVWQSWGDPVAQGSGFAFANDCEPSCVAGGVHHAAAEMYVSRLRRCSGKLQYTYAVIVAAKASIAERTTGAYDIACVGQKSYGVLRTEPESEISRVAPGAPTAKEVREEMKELKERKAQK